MFARKGWCWSVGLTFCTLCKEFKEETQCKRASVFPRAHFIAFGKGSACQIAER